MIINKIKSTVRKIEGSYILYEFRFCNFFLYMLSKFVRIDIIYTISGAGVEYTGH